MSAEECGDGAAACAVAVTCSANDALSMGGLPKFAEPASRLTSLAAARELLMPLSSLLIIGIGSFKQCMRGSDLGVHSKPSVAFLCRSGSRKPSKPGADGRSMFACTTIVIRPPASQSTPSLPQTASSCSKSSTAGSTEL